MVNKNLGNVTHIKAKQGSFTFESGFGSDGTILSVCLAQDLFIPILTPHILSIY